MAKHLHRKGEVTLEAILSELYRREDAHKVGAIAVFIGIVRGISSRGEVEKLEIEAYEEMAEDRLERICKELEERDGIVAVEIHHFTGEFKVGEVLVYVIVAGSHRKEVFETLVEAVERYKRETPLFKKEILRSGDSYWVEEHII
ncbi:MAG: molybdenum cofactor biosynthesis protein MoaE [Nitrososphaerota archaeon]|nr:molybdenum cofactor biosynthesis protein MoaE [Candidatus Bathyarchaeota archaeon]MCX8162228.1 molybdenum cofactor biosynthesis protein MoaE [Candidatus Bathyarchaeota archaeon]MDW8061593.1 molybdenum cofactor biosynthesis protein MoaE [Nitrososphaerota archaeon]